MNGGSGDFGCITESSENNGVVIDKPLFSNRFGIAKLEIDESITTDENGYYIFSAEDFTISFQSTSIVGPEYLLQNSEQNTAIFTAPPSNAFPNSCLNYNRMYVRFDFNILYASRESFEGAVFYTINSTENKTIVVLKLVNTSTESPPELQADSTLYSDILVLEPGDEVGIFTILPSDLTIQFLSKSYILIEILGFE